MDKHHELSETWINITKSINAGKFKKVYEEMMKKFGLSILQKGIELKNESIEKQTDLSISKKRQIQSAVLNFCFSAINCLVEIKW